MELTLNRTLTQSSQQQLKTLQLRIMITLSIAEILFSKLLQLSNETRGKQQNSMKQSTFERCKKKENNLELLYTNEDKAENILCSFKSDTTKFTRKL